MKLRFTFDVTDEERRAIESASGARFPVHKASRQKVQEFIMRAVEDSLKYAVLFLQEEEDARM